MDSAPDTDWLTPLINRIDGRVIVEEWPAETSLLAPAPGVRTAPEGHPVRAVPCAGCELGISGIPFVMWTLIGPYPCDRNGNHLISVTVLLHVTCQIDDRMRLAEIIRARTADCFDQ